MYDHQWRAVEFGSKKNSAALLMEMGTGKSRCGIHIVEAWRASRVLIVAPKTLLENWHQEWAKWGITPHEFSIIGVARDLASRVRPGAIDVRAINYERAWRMEKELLAWKPEVVICDEGHRIKNRGSKQAKSMHRVGAAVPHRLLLTGTPVTQSPLDLWSQMKFVDPTVLPKRYKEFAERYADFGGYGGWQILRYKNLDELAQKVAQVSYSCTLAEAVDLPPETEQVLRVDLDSKARRIYEDARKHALATLPQGECSAPNALAQLQLLQRIAGGHARVDAGDVVRVHDAKLKALHDVVESLLEAGRPALVFARYRAELESARATLAPLGRVASLHGDTSAEERASAVEDFQAGRLKILLCQPSVGGVGLTLTAASTAIHYSLDYSLATHEQARARIRRIGQSSPTVQLYLVSRGTVDEDVLECLQGKRDLARMTGDEIRKAIEGRR